MARNYAFVQVDVFTDQVFGGNPLAVFLEPRGLSDAEMQAIAREMNLSETTFVFPAQRADCAAHVRIFAPTRELPFAGHPTVGTGWVLAQKAPGKREFCLEEGVGPVPVRVDDNVVWMRHSDPEWGPELTDRATVAAAIGLEPSDLLPEKPIRTGSTGAKFLYVPLKDPATVDRASRADVRRLNSLLDDGVGVFVFAPDTARGRSRVYSRMFGADAGGVPEDPATGSASGPLGAYVAEHRLVELSNPIEIVSLQGQKMGRPSLISIRLRLEAGRACEIEVGGGVVPVLEGVLALPS